MPIDAIILTGGRSSRLDFVPKSEFVVDSVTLVERSLSAADPARRTVIVGRAPEMVLPAGVRVVREEPPFGGPVSGIAAGVTALFPSTASATTSEESATADDAVLILACDMPHIGSAVPSLVRSFNENPHADGVLAVDSENRRQPLAAIYRALALVAALKAAAGGASRRAGGRASAVATEGTDPFAGLPMFLLLDHMTLVDVPVPDDATADVDTWDDAARLGAHPPLDHIAKFTERFPR